MRKRWLCLIALVVLIFAGCTNTLTENVKDSESGTEITDALMQTEQKAAWGVTLIAKDVTAKGLTIVCTQSGGEPAGELQTGSWYEVQRLENGVWKKVEYTEIEQEYVGWTAEAWCIPKEDTIEWEVDWSWLYDELPGGDYRIGKEIMDFRETGEYDEAVIYAEFTIE